MQVLQSIFPAAFVNEVIELRNEVIHGTAVLAMAEWNAAVHTAGTLRLRRLAIRSLLKLFVMLDAFRRRLCCQRRARKFHESSRLTHVSPLMSAFQSAQ